MISKSPFRQDSCAEQKKKMFEQYKKDGKLKEYKKEVKTFGCVKGKWQSKIKEEQDPKPAPNNPSTNIGLKDKSVIQN